MPVKEKSGIKLFTNTIWDGAMTTKYGRNLIIRMKLENNGTSGILGR